MKQKPFAEKKSIKPVVGEDVNPVNPDKSDFEDLVNKQLGEMVKGLNDMKAHSDKGKVEKDESSEKYNKDYGDINKNNKDTADKQHKIEKLEHKEFVKEHDVHPVTKASDPANLNVEERLAALEKTIGQLSHFITSGLRPDLSKGALKQESKKLPSSGKSGQ
jgi:hypothetical protein